MTDEPKDEGFYWATSIRRNARKSKENDYGQSGGLRWIVRVFRYDDDEVMRVQIFGSERLRDVRDYKDWEGPIGHLYWPKTIAQQQLKTVGASIPAAIETKP